MSGAAWHFKLSDFNGWPARISDGLTIPCSRCGKVPKFDYVVSGELWNRVVPKEERTGAICLACFDRLCDLSGESVWEHLEQVQFTGQSATIVLIPAFVVER